MDTEDIIISGVIEDIVYSNPEKAEKVLGWKAKRTLVDMCRDLWTWQKNNPNGYGK